MPSEALKFSHSKILWEVILLLGVRPFAVFLGFTVVGESKGEGVMWQAATFPLSSQRKDELHYYI